MREGGRCSRDVAFFLSVSGSCGCHLPFTKRRGRKIAAFSSGQAPCARRMVDLTYTANKQKGDVPAFPFSIMYMF